MYTDMTLGANDRLSRAGSWNYIKNPGLISRKVGEQKQKTRHGIASTTRGGVFPRDLVRGLGVSIQGRRRMETSGGGVFLFCFCFWVKFCSAGILCPVLGGWGLLGLRTRCLSLVWLASCCCCCCCMYNFDRFSLCLFSSHLSVFIHHTRNSSFLLLLPPPPHTEDTNIYLHFPFLLLLLLPHAYFRLKLHPSVKRALPPVGWHNTVEQPPQTTTV